MLMSSDRILVSHVGSRRARDRPDHRPSAPGFRYDCDDAAGADEHSRDLAGALLEIF
jgi:hypothetical protein